MSDDKKTRGARFVEHALRRCAEDKGFAARLRRADNPDTEYQSWGDLAALGTNIEKDGERQPHALVAASLARLKTPGDGRADLGEALRSCFEEQGQGETRLRRLLACERPDELCAVLRPLLRLIHAHSAVPLSHARLLDDLLSFPSHRQRIRRRWAQNFYRLPASDPETDADGAADEGDA